jgi:hypothetical protein
MLPGPTLSPALEPRWPAILAVLVMGSLLMALPHRFRLLPVGLDGALMLVGMLPMLAAALSGGARRWMAWERKLVSLFLIASMVLESANLFKLIKILLFSGDQLGAQELLASGLALWVSNVVLFALAYWHGDQGGPESRRQDHPPRADWHFPQQDLPEVGGDAWRPAFLDYLFLAYCNATAFSPTGAVPLRGRAMVLMMAESAVSLITLAVIAARAINILDT